MNRSKYLIFAFSIVFVILAVTLLVSRKQAGKADTALRISGTVEATSTIASFKVSGRLLQRTVDEGETVHRGQVLARLDPTDLEQELAIRRAELAAGREIVAELEAGTRKEELARGEAAVKRIEADENRLAADFTRQEELLKLEVISVRDYEASRAAYFGVTAQAREMREQLRELRNGPRPETIRQARARVASLRSALELARNRLNDATLMSPADGTVMAKHLEPGELLNPGTPVVTIGDLDNVWIRCYIPETEIGKVRQGQGAMVTIDSFPGHRYNGTVTFISQEAEFTPKNIQTEKERVKLVFRIKIKVMNRNRELKPGMPVDVILNQ